MKGTGIRGLDQAAVTEYISAEANLFFASTLLNYRFRFLSGRKRSEKRWGGPPGRGWAELNPFKPFKTVLKGLKGFKKN